MSKGLITSGLLHTALLLAGLISFTPKPNNDDLLQVTDVNILTGEEFDMIFSAAPKTPITEVPQPEVPDISANIPPSKPVTPPEPEPVNDDPLPELLEVAQAELEKPIVKTEPDTPPEPEPEVKEPEPETEPQPEPELEPEPKEVVPQTAPKETTEPIKRPKPPQPTPPKEEKKPEPKKPEPKKEEVKKPEPKQENTEDDFLKKLNAAISETSEQSSQSSKAPVVGPPLTYAEKEGLQFAIKRCWSVPVGAIEAEKLVVTIGVKLSKSGEVEGQPVLVSPKNSDNPAFNRAFEAARRAILRCAPYSMPAEKYDQWKDLEITFNPEQMVIQ